MTPLDWGLVVAYCLLVLGLGFWAQSREAGKDTENYFLSGRKLPWWIAGASMAASAFSVDTPIYVTKLTQSGGVKANWEWWFVGASGILGATVMARYWRRAGIVTDLELITLRYAGRQAHVLRGFRAVFFGLLFNPLGMAAVIAALIKVLSVVDPTLADQYGWPEGDGVWIVAAVVLVSVTYSVLSGFMGVVLTDLAQFVVSIAGACVMAYCAVTHPKVGGLASLAEQVGDKAEFMPSFDSWDKPVVAFAIFMGVSLWTFVNADGGGKFIHRLAACRDEGEAEKATWFSTLTFVGLRSWPWILVALATLLIFPGGDSEAAYPKFMMQLAPGLRGFVFASMVAAFMSTIDTQLNWGASYLVNDLLRPYVLKKRSERFYVWAARFCAVPTLLIVLLLFWVMAQPPGTEGESAGLNPLSVTKVLRSVILVSSGLGAVYLLRWFWWRLTAWGEIAAMVAAPTAASLCTRFELGFAPKVLLITGCTLAAAAVISLAFPSADRSHLERFVERVQPAGFWGPLRSAGAQGGLGWLLFARFLGGNAILFGFTFALGGALLCRGWALVLGNVALIVAGLLLDRWARGRLPKKH